MTKKTSSELEISGRKRFWFGKNWRNFVDNKLNGERIKIAESSLRDMLDIEDMKGRTFLDIGCGSGLFSLAAYRLGADVFSFDFDSESVECTRELQTRFFPDARNWTIREGSILDRPFLEELGTFDIVYAWGVLHHTGDMWTALNNASSLTKNGGLHFVAIYNDEGVRSKFWKLLKKLYCSSIVYKYIIISVFVPLLHLNSIVKNTRKERGMSRIHDYLDWLGGFPYEVAQPEEIVEFYEKSGYVLRIIRKTNGSGNNQFVFRRVG